MHTTTTQKVFISHSTRDQRDLNLAHKLAAGLRTWGVEVWIAPESLPSGEEWEPRTVSAILDGATHFLVILSESSVRSDWVLKEISLARARVERDRSLKILSLRVGALPEFEHAGFLRRFQDLPYVETFAGQLRQVAATLSLPPALPAAPFSDLIVETTRHFVGRENVFSALQKFIANERKGCFMLVGDPGEGKTTILAEYVRRTGSPAHFNIAPLDIVTTARLVENLGQQMAAHFDATPLGHPGESPSLALQLARLLEQAAARRPDGEPVVIVIDALDEARAEAPGVNVLHLPPVLPEGVFLFLSRRRKVIPFTTRERLFEFELLKHAEDSRQDVERYLQRRLPDPVFEPWLRTRQWTIEQATNELADRSQNNFMYLHHILGALASGELADIGQQLPTGLQDFYEYQWRHMRKDAAHSDLALNALYLLVLLRRPVSVRLLADIIGAPASDVRAVLKEWREFLHTTPEDGQTCYRLYHSSFEDFLRAREELEDIDSARYSEQIADYFGNKLFG